MSDDPVIQNNRIIDKIAIFLIGAFNTAPYLIGNYAIQNVLITANYEKYYLILYWISIVIIILSRFLNSLFVSLSFSYDICFIVYLCLMQIGLLAAAFVYNFWTAMICIILINFSTSFMDSAILCYITYRKKQALLNPWICGVTTSGLISAGYTFLCAKYDVSIFWTFIVFAFFPPIYALLYFIILTRSPQSSLPNTDTRKGSNANIESESNDGLHQRMLDDLSENPYDKAENNENNENAEQPNTIEDNSTPIKTENDDKVGFCNMSYFHNSWILIISCCIVFFLYVCINGFIKSFGLKFEMDNVYSIPYMYLCFQIGFFISGCTIIIVQIRQVWIFMLFLILLFTFTCCQAFIHFTKNLIYYPIMFVFGLCCGFPYINTLYFLMNDETKNTKQRELSTSWNLFFISFFIDLSIAFLYIYQIYYNRQNE